MAKNRLHWAEVEARRSGMENDNPNYPVLDDFYITVPDDEHSSNLFV